MSVKSIYGPVSKTVQRQDLTDCRYILRKIAQAITVDDWATVEDLAREVESIGSRMACDAKEKAEALS